MEACKAKGLRPHPARFPDEIPKFFIQLLTEPGDLVMDPFAGSNVTGQVSEVLGRRWMAIDVERDYVVGSAARFEGLQLGLPSHVRVAGSP